MLPWGLSCRTVGTEAQLAQRHCVATVLLRQRTVHQNDSKFPDASLTLAKNPPQKLWSLALFPPNPSSLPLPSLSTPDLSVSLAALDRFSLIPFSQPIPHPKKSIYGSLVSTCSRKSSQRTSKPTPSPAAPLDSINQSINPSINQLITQSPTTRRRRTAFKKHHQPTTQPISQSKSPTVAYYNGAHENYKFELLE